jgi:hypothetical protein
MTGPFGRQDNRRFILLSLATALVGAGLAAIEFALDTTRAWFAYLNAWNYGVSICIGALVLLMAGHASKASWMVVTRRLTESVVTVMPLYLLLFIPIALALPHIYPWASHSPPAAMREAIEHKRSWLNPPFFVLRSLFYFLVFIVVGGLLRAWSKANDERPTYDRVKRMRALGGGALPLVALTLTWASFDWTMSLQPDWWSTIYGLYFFSGGFVGALALLCVLLHYSRRATADHAQAVGRLLFAMIIFWAYMSFSQLLIYWIADVPDEITYYKVRTTGSWAAVSAVLVFCHFFIPFFFLLSRQLKRHKSYLVSVGGYMLAMHFVDAYWLVLPAHDAAGARPDVGDLGCLLFVGGLSCAWSAWAYTRAAPLPLHAPELAKGLDYQAAIQ